MVFTVRQLYINISKSTSTYIQWKDLLDRTLELIFQTVEYAK